ncbi:MAG: hypothetical protein R3C05_11680 [Pirellulaceae bacterium]
MSSTRSEDSQPMPELSVPKIDHGLIVLLRMGVFFCFAGWTWVHLYWEAPYGILLWHDATYQWASRFGISWDDFVGSGANDGLVQTWMGRIGWLYLTCAVVALTVRKHAWLQMVGLVCGSMLLVILSYAKFLSAQRQLPMFVEHGGQMLMPVVLVSALALGVRHRATIILAIIAFVTTFAGHGSYAIGLWPTPATFYAMTSVILHVEYETAQTFLRIAGMLDFIVCVGLFIPPIRRYCAMYAVAWGFLTAVARPAAGMSWSLNYWGRISLSTRRCFAPRTLSFRCTFSDMALHSRRGESGTTIVSSRTRHDIISV